VDLVYAGEEEDSGVLVEVFGEKAKGFCTCGLV
jgi:hypothetical protein